MDLGWEIRVLLWLEGEGDFADGTRHLVGTHTVIGRQTDGRMSGSSGGTNLVVRSCRHCMALEKCMNGHRLYDRLRIYPLFN